MKIIRDGIEFELTSEELFAAYLEQEAIFDRTNIQENMECYLSPELYGRLKNNEDFLDAAAARLRKNQDDYAMGYESALSEAFNDTVKDFFLPVNRVTVIRECYSEQEIWTDDFWVDANRVPSKELFQEVIEAFLVTSDGQKAVEETCNDFNWGDAVVYIPDDFWNSFGIYPLDYHTSPEELGLAPTSSDNLTRIQVDQDEVLIPNDYLDRLKACGEKKVPLADQIHSASTRVAEANSADKVPTKESAPER